MPFKIFKYRISRMLGIFSPLPISIALYVTSKCNSRCSTCNIWKQNDNTDLTLEEIQRSLATIGRSPIWFTITGGEPFLRDDIVEIVSSICTINRPLFINIASNGLANQCIRNKINAILEVCAKYRVKLTINLSLDEVFDNYDIIRGTANGFNRLLETYKYLQSINNKQMKFNLGTNTTLSKYNVERFDDIFLYIVDNLHPNSMLFEFASLRETFHLKEELLRPSYDHIVAIIESIKDRKLYRQNRTARFIHFFRGKYYRYLRQLLDNSAYLPCYAGIASAEIVSNGDVVSCCLKGTLLGNLRHHHYNFKSIWSSAESKKVRREIKRSKCSCDLSNIFYTNSIVNMKFFFK